jgi:hypothetical protein
LKYLLIKKFSNYGTVAAFRPGKTVIPNNGGDNPEKAVEPHAKRKVRR